MEIKDLTFIDLFAGVGMARMGMEQAGFKCVYTCEFDKHKRKEYEIIHGNIPEGCDIKVYPMNTQTNSYKQVYQIVKSTKLLVMDYPCQ